MDIYKITNKVNGKIYIGKDQYGYKNRFKEHLQTAKSKKYSVSHLYSAMNKYGYDNFYVEKIDERDTIEELNNCEKYWIYKLDSTNPSTCGKLMTEKYGSGVYCCRKCASTHKHTDETKKLLSDMNKAGVCGNKGKKLTDEHKKKISDAHKGKIVSEETRKKISESKKGTTPWNKGLTKEDPRVKANVDKRNKTMLNTYGTLNGYMAHTMKEETYEN